MDIMYQASAVSTGGRDGQVFVENMPIHFEMALPNEMGGKKGVGFNPEQLFAAGYAACFGSAVQHFVRLKRMNIAPPEIHVKVGIGRNETGGFALKAAIEAVFTGISQAEADDLAANAHTICPYSNAVRGNVEVQVSAKVV